MSENKRPKKRMKFEERYTRYLKYPIRLMAAAMFRDAHDDLPDEAFFALAEERGLMDDLIELADYEEKNNG